MNTPIIMLKKISQFKILPILICLFFTMGGFCQSASVIQEDTSTFLMKEGIQRIKIISNLSDTKNEFIATLFTVEDTSLYNFGLISRKNFPDTFSFEGIEKMCAQDDKDLVLQVAGAFTPDWKVIEGYALENGKSVGQDHFLGENKKISYRGLCLIKNGCPHITHLDNILDMQGLLEKARNFKWSLFQQVAAIIDGKRSNDMVLPRSAKRRFLVEVKQGEKTKFGIINSR